MQHEIDGATVRVDAYGNMAAQKSSPGHLGYGPMKAPPMAMGGAVRSNPMSGAERDKLKIWVGGLSQETSKKSLDAYFNQFGKADGIVMLDGATGRSRGFGFVNFFDENVLRTIMAMQHEIDGAPVRVDLHGNSQKQLAGLSGAGCAGGVAAGVPGQMAGQMAGMMQQASMMAATPQLQQQMAMGALQGLAKEQAEYFGVKMPAGTEMYRY